EMWNEADFAPFWNNAPNATQYFSYMQAAYQGIKQGDPTATVLMCGLAMPQDTTWFTQLLSLGGGAYFDIANVHIYPAFATFSGALGTVRGELAQFGLTNKPIWITETSTTGAYFETTNRDYEEYQKS